MIAWTFPEELFASAGLAGVVLYLGAYAALQGGLIRGSGYLYASLNLIAAGLVLVSLTLDFNLAAALIQISWIAISIVGMTRIFLLTTGIRFNDEEKQLLERKLPFARPLAARRFLDAASWVDAPAGTVLLREGETHGMLIYLESGEARVDLAGVHLGTVEPGSFLGEMTVLENTPASATVTLTKPARYLRIGAAEIKRLCARDQEFRLQLEYALGHDTRMKLLATNLRLRGAVEKQEAVYGNA